MTDLIGKFTSILRKITRGSRIEKSNLAQFDLQPEDVFLVSYPRSGNTWVRFLLANILKEQGQEIDFHNLHQYVPELTRNPDVIKSMNSPRIIKSHVSYHDQYPRVIYLVRDGRDVYTSYYYYRLNQLTEDWSFSRFLREYDHYPCLWSDHVSSWLFQNPAADQVLLVKYEDLLVNPEGELKRMLRYIGIQARPERIKEAVQASRFERMKEIDQTKGRKYSPTNADEFVRKGKAGSWRNLFSDQDIAFFKQREGDVLLKLGYEKRPDWTLEADERVD